MPSKRDVLAHLTRDELVAIVTRLELPVADRRVRDQLVEAVAASKRATLAETLPDLSRDRLKELCRALALDDSGRDKAGIVDRLAGAKPADAAVRDPVLPVPVPVPVRSKSASKPGSTATAASLDLAPGEKLTVDKLERYLWSAADILRGLIDSSDYKNFIFGLLFLKRLSDRFAEECEALEREGLDPEDKDEHEFFVPPRARWGELQRASTNLGDALNKA